MRLLIIALFLVFATPSFAWKPTKEELTFHFTKRLLNASERIWQKHKDVNDKISRIAVRVELQNWLEDQKKEGVIRYFDFIAINDMGNSFEIMVFYRYPNQPDDSIERETIVFKFPQKKVDKQHK